MVDNSALLRRMDTLEANHMKHLPRIGALELWRKSLLPEVESVVRWQKDRRNQLIGLEARIRDTEDRLDQIQGRPPSLKAGQIIAPVVLAEPTPTYADDGEFPRLPSPAPAVGRTNSFLEGPELAEAAALATASVPR